MKIENSRCSHQSLSSSASHAGRPRRTSKEARSIPVCSAAAAANVCLELAIDPTAPHHVHLQLYSSIVTAHVACVCCAQARSVGGSSGHDLELLGTLTATEVRLVKAIFEYVIFTKPSYVP